MTAFVNLYNASSTEMMDGLYSSFDENDADDFNRFSFLIYSVNEKTNKLQAAGMIQLEEIEENPYIKHEYNLEFHRWFIIEDSDIATTILLNGIKRAYMYNNSYDSLKLNTFLRFHDMF